MSRTREHVVLLDRAGHGRYHHADGRPFLDPDRYAITLMTPLSKLASVVPDEVEHVIGGEVPPKALLGLLREVARTRPIDHVAALSERLLLPAAELRAELGLGGPQPPLITALRDKLVMKRQVAAAGVRVPEHLPVERAVDAAPLLRRHGTIILKPTSGMGSQGVHVVRSADELAVLDEQPDALAGAYEAEEFIDGDLIHVDSVVVRGRATAVSMSRYLDPTTAFARVAPFRSVDVCNGDQRRALADFNDTVLGAFGEFSGASHLEVFRRRDGELVFCEIAGRPGGAGVIPVFRHHFGVDLYEASLLGQLDPDAMPTGDAAVAPPPERAAAGWIGLFGGPGTLDELRVPEADWIVDTIRRKHEGQHLDAPMMSGDAVVFVTVTGPDADTVTRRLDEVGERSTVRVRHAEETFRDHTPPGAGTS